MIAPACATAADIVSSSTLPLSNRVTLAVRGRFRLPRTRSGLRGNKRESRSIVAAMLLVIVGVADDEPVRGRRTWPGVVAGIERQSARLAMNARAAAEAGLEATPGEIRNKQQTVSCARNVLPDRVRSVRRTIGDIPRNRVEDSEDSDSGETLERFDVGAVPGLGKTNRCGVCRLWPDIVKGPVRESPIEA
jgi:hypothetical protein